MSALHVAIIGAGPAGCAAAIGLAQAHGCVVTLIESAPFPRVKVCGECISPAAAGVLESLLSVDQLTALGARRARRYILERANAARSWETPEPTWSVSRGTLDLALLAQARHLGARVLHPATVEGVEYKDDAVVLRLRGMIDLHADLVLHADGKGRHDPAGPTPMRPGVVGCKCLMRLPIGTLSGIHMRSAPGAYIGLVEVEDGLATCALTVRASLLAQVKGDHDALLGSLWPAYQPAWRAAAGPLGTWLSCGIAASNYITPGHPRSLRLGNAAAAVEPIGGEGIGLALWSGARAATLVRDALGAAAGAPLATRTLKRIETMLAREYHRRLRFRRPTCRAAAAILMRPALVGALWPLLSQPAVSLSPWWRLSGKVA